MLVDQLYTTLQSLQLHILFLLGLTLFLGTVGGRLFQRLRIPQVVGYLIIGFIVGHHVLNIVDMETIAILNPFNYFALGLIGFMIGGELKKEVFKKYGKQFFTILLAEGFGAFIFVFILVGVIGSLIFKGNGFYWELGLLLGAIASATAPAATTDVLWEMKARGPLTTTVLGIIAMDDCLSLLLFAVASSIVAKLIGTNIGNGLLFAIRPLYEIGVSIGIGIILGLALSKILTKEHINRDRVLILSLATVLITLGLTLMLKLDMLLAVMALGVVLANRIPRISKDVFDVVSAFAPPIYVLFFVLVGAKLNLSHLNLPLLLLVVIYLIGRSGGKMVGANLGAKASKAPASVQKYLPFCLFSQAGVAIALTMVVSELFPGHLGNVVVIIIAISTFAVQLIGPPATRFAAIKAGECGLNITQDDIIRTAKASDLLTNMPPLIPKNMPLNDILNQFKSTNYLYYPVVDKDVRLIGVITLDSLRQTFMEADLTPLLVAHDLIEPVSDKVYTDTPLMEIKENMDKRNLNYLPVLKKDGTYAGIIESTLLTKFISTKMLELDQKIASLA